MNQQTGIYYVGGVVRDVLMGVEPKDRDYLVVGYTRDQMIKAGFTHTATAGGFPVFHHPETKEEYALARTEVKNGVGYKGFDTLFSPDVTIEEDLSRRDLTINAMAAEIMPDVNGYPVLSKIYDPFGGQIDIQNKILRHVNLQADPLRIFRIARFMARFGPGWVVAPETVKYCQEMPDDEIGSISYERVWTEIIKALNTDHPRRFFDFLHHVNKLHIFLPEISDLVSCEENVKWHPEGNTYEHTMLVLEQAAKRKANITVRLAALFHDIGKPLSGIRAKENEKYADRIGFFPGHDAIGSRMVYAIGKRFDKNLKDVAIITRNHMKLHVVNQMRHEKIMNLIVQFDVRHNSQKLNDFCEMGECDNKGRLGHENITDSVYAEFFAPYVEAIRNTVIPPGYFDKFKSSDRDAILDAKMRLYVKTFKENFKEN